MKCMLHAMKNKSLFEGICLENNNLGAKALYLILEFYCMVFLILFFLLKII
jgi:hypothetical protein